MARIVVAGIVEFAPQVRDEALIKGRELIEGAYTEKGCIHYLWTADLNHPGRVVVYEEWECVSYVYVMYILRLYILTFLPPVAHISYTDIYKSNSHLGWQH